MTTAAPTAPPIPTYEINGWFNVADLLHDLGDVDASRVRMNPRPGSATLDDLIAANESKERPICEWVDGTLVEKVMGFHESTIENILIFEFELYLRSNDIGMTAGPDGVMRILPGIGRAPDVTFIRWESLPGGKPPARSDKVPAVVPDLVVEVLSASNRPREVARKREEYFRAGVKLVWEIDPETRSAKAFTSLTDMEPIPANGTLDAGDVMLGFQLSLRAVFDRAERRG
jgi:Uma2 family endonuclease